MKLVVSISWARISETILQCQACSSTAGRAYYLSWIFSLIDFKSLKVLKNSSKINPDCHGQLSLRVLVCTIPCELLQLFITNGTLMKEAVKQWKLKGHYFESHTLPGISPALCIAFPQCLSEISIWMTGSWLYLSPGNTSVFSPGALSDRPGVCLQSQASFTSSSKAHVETDVYWDPDFKDIMSTCQF